MSYNSARDELFLADCNNGVVRAMRVRDTAGDLHDVYSAPLIYSVCHLNDSDTLLVCSGEEGPEPERNCAKWIVALSRNDSEWRESRNRRVELVREARPLRELSAYYEAQRLRRDCREEWCVANRLQTGVSGHIICPLSGSRVLIGESNSKRIELFRVKSGPRIAPAHLIDVPEEYAYFSATSGSDTLVAMTYRSPDN